MKPGDVLPQSVVGALITLVLLLVIDGYGAVVSKSQLSNPNTIVWPLLLMTLLAFAVGGFIAAYIAARKAKNVLDRALAASSLSAIIAVFLVGVFSFLSILMITNSSMGMVVANLMVMFIILGAVGISLSVIGGLVLALILGYGKSMVAASLKRGWRPFLKSPKAIVLPLVFSLGSFAVVSVSKDYIPNGTLGDVAAMVVLLVSGLLIAYTISSIVAAMQKKQKLGALLKQSLKGGKRVFAALVALAVPPFAVAVAMAYGMGSLPGLDVLWSLVLLLFAGAMALYLFIFALVPQVMMLSKKGVRKAFAESYRRVKSEWLVLVGVLAIVVLFGMLFEMGMYGLDLLFSLARFDSSLFTSWISMAIEMIVLTAALTGFYMEAKK